MRYSIDDSSLVEDGRIKLNEECFRKSRLNAFLKKIEDHREGLGRGVKHLVELESQCDNHFEEEVSRLNESFKVVMREIQLCYSTLYKKLEKEVDEKKREVQVSRESSSTILSELILTKKDVEDNFENIVLYMDIEPFADIMENYTMKMKCIELQIEELARHECNIGRLEENKDYMSQVCANLRHMFTVKKVEKVNHKKFNSEEVIFDPSRSMESGMKSIHTVIQHSDRRSRYEDEKRKLMKVWNTSGRETKEDSRIQQQYRKMTSEMISEGLQKDKLLTDEVKELISRVDDMMISSERCKKDRFDKISRSDSSVRSTKKVYNAPIHIR